MPFVIPDTPDFFLDNKGGGFAPPRGGPGAPPPSPGGGFGPGGGGGGAFFNAGRASGQGLDPYGEIRRRKLAAFGGGGGGMNPEMLQQLMQLFQRAGISTPQGGLR